MACTKPIQIGESSADCWQKLFCAYAQSRTEEFMFFSHEKRFLRLSEEHPNIIERIPTYHISSFLGITIRH
ncbi:hypothetical protein [Pedobacter sp.]|uniref:hypothetical protein n=1 Tax=Pedobacter sp. TaxID=1411316 RepID=UPI003D7F98C1